MVAQIEWALEIGKQAPALVVLVILVSMFLKRMNASDANLEKISDGFRATVDRHGEHIEGVTTHCRDVQQRAVEVIGENTEALRGCRTVHGELVNCIYDLKKTLDEA